MTSLATGWPFWAPSDLESVDRALDLAEVRPGDVVADLGCGDGQVLVAAARRGARVIGIECDAELADHAREALAANGLEGEVLVGDLLDLHVEADVYFTYLAPATLQRVLPALTPRHGARLVSVDFAVPGLEPHVEEGRVHRYDLPGRPAPRRAPGWESAGLLVVVPPDCQSLTVLDLQHPGGPVRCRLTGALDGAVAVLTGVDDAERDQHVAVDLRWEPLALGDHLQGVLTVTGAPSLPVFVIAAEDDEGQWELSEEGIANLTAALEAGGVELTAAAFVHAATEGPASSR